MKKFLLFLTLIVVSAPIIANSTNVFIKDVEDHSTFLLNFTCVVDVTLESCDDDGDGMADFDLAMSIPDVLAGMNASDFVVTFHETRDDANSGANDIDTNFMFSSDSQTIYSRIEQVADASMFSVSEVNLISNKIPVTNFPTDIFYEVCPENKEPIQILTNGDNYHRDNVSFQWYKDGALIQGETTQRITIVQPGFYEIEVTYNNTGCSSREGREIMEVQNCIVPQGISPNGDGMNDALDLTDFRVENIEIFNRYGMKVFSQSNYTNQWRGQTDDGKDLPVGTYFYTMNYKEGQKTSGWVYIQREK